MAGEALFVVTVHTKTRSSDYYGYKNERCSKEYFEQHIVNNPEITCFESVVGQLCGLNLKVYFKKSRKGLASYYRESGVEAMHNAVIQLISSGAFAKNNGAATFLTIDPACGLCEYLVTGKAYVVQDDGKAPLSRDQVWGIQEIVNCLMNIYDADPENIRKGFATCHEWASQYRLKQWEPPFGTGGINIYRDRAV